MSLSSVIRYVQALDTSATDGSGKTGLAFGDFTAKYLTEGGTLTSLTTETITTLGTYQAPTSNAHIRIKEVSNADPTKGLYEVHFHDDQMAVAGKNLWLMLSATGARIQPLWIPLADLSGRLPAALTSDGNMKSDTLRVGGTTQTAGDLTALINTLTGYVDTEVAAILAAVDTEVAAIKAKTDNLPSDPADASDIAASFATVNSTLSTIAGYLDTEVAAILAAVDTEVAAIKAKTDNLPADPADASDVADAFSALTTIANAIKAKSDLLNFVGSGTNAVLKSAFWVATGTITDAAPTQTSFKTDLVGIDGLWNDSQLVFTTGNNINPDTGGPGKAIPASNYGEVGGFGVFTFSEAWPGTVQNGDQFFLIGEHQHSPSALATEVWSYPSLHSIIRTALGMAAANMDTQLGTIAGYLDTEIAAILAAVDTEVAAIKAKTDNLPSDPADQSAVEAAIMAFGTTPMSYSARATGAMPTRDQLMLELLAGLLMHSTTGLVKTLKKPDGTDSTKTYRFDADPPTLIEELT